MIFRTRNIPKQLNAVHNFGIKNLIVSGCSFTYNDLDNTSLTWPYFLRDLGGFDQVLDTSLPGAGNSHISNSLIWALEMDKPDPADSLVIVMWSGHDRDDYIFPKENVNNYSTPFYYSKNVMSSIKNAGDLCPESNRNGIADELKKLSTAKSYESRAIENYLYIAKTYQYLKSLDYKFLFLNFINFKESIQGEVGGTNSFDIRKHLPNLAKQRLNSMITEIDDPYHFSVRYNLLGADDFHPGYYGHLRWTRKVLIPHLQTVVG
jgi:hypothetical protein